MEKVVLPQFQELAMFILKCTSHCPVHLQEDFSHHQLPMNSHSSPSPPVGPASTSRSAVSLSPTMDETTLALSPTAKDSASAVLQESNHTSELETSSLLQSPTASNESHLTPSPAWQKFTFVRTYFYLTISCVSVTYNG